MRGSYTLFVLNHQGLKIRQIMVSRLFLAFCALLFVGVLAATGYVLNDYLALKKTYMNTCSLDAALENSREELARQRKQIRLFANDINTMKAHLAELSRFEKKIRIIANLEDTIEQGGVFGVGGSTPEDLNENLPADVKHNSLIREMSEQSEFLKQAAGNQEKGFASLLEFLEEQRNLLASTPAIRPVKGWVTSGFGRRVSPFTGQREFHKGLDIAASKGTPVRATADGVVSFAGKKGFMGNMIVVDHGHGLITRYAHLYKFNVKKGQAVKRGDVIAQVGATGRTTGPHLHYEVHLNGLPVDPSRYILN